MPGVEYSLTELYEFRDAVYDDWDMLAADWDLLNVRVAAAWNAVWLWVAWTDPIRLEEFEAYLADRYGYVGWVIDLGMDPPTGEQI